MSRRRTDLRIEELGQRVLPSANPLGLFANLPTTPQILNVQNQFILHHSTEQHALHGSGVAVYTVQMQVPDIGTHYHLQGAGAFGTLGVVTIAGDINGVGFINHGHATGTLTFTNAQGSVTIELTGPEQNAFAPLPQKFDYQITGGTGAYQNLQDQGTLTLHTVTSGAGFGVFTIRI